VAGADVGVAGIGVAAGHSAPAAEIAPRAFAIAEVATLPESPAYTTPEFRIESLTC
jgi:hypothetical protein